MLLTRQLASCCKILKRLVHCKDLGDVFLILSSEHLLVREKGKRHNEKHPSGEKKADRAPRGESIECRPDEINDREAFCG